jgi:hypothetical protein
VSRFVVGTDSAIGNTVGQRSDHGQRLAGWRREASRGVTDLADGPQARPGRAAIGSAVPEWGQIVLPGRRANCARESQNGIPEAE